MKLSLKKTEIYKYVYLILALICAFWIISTYDIIVSKALSAANTGLGTIILYKFLNDFWYGLIIGGMLFPVYFLMSLFAKRGALIVQKVIFALLVIIQFSLVKYSITTQLNLGADILGYSFDDAFTTVTASEGLSVLYFAPFVIFPVLFFLLFMLIHKYFSKRIVIGIGLSFILLFGSLKMILPEISNVAYQNKTAFLANDVLKFQKEKRKLNALNLSDRNDYPLLKPFESTNDVLSPFFNIKEEKPNVVILMVEGLGSEFIGDGAYSGFTPYLDSLISKSLYWENFVSITGRTFGVVPSLLGSLPLGETGFLELPKTPSHVSLISVLKANGYTTSYFSGDQSSFDKKINFLEYNGIDNVIDENKFGPDYVKTEANSGGFSWGYPDAEIFRKTLASLDATTQPRLDLILTLSNHEPFNFPNKEHYEAKVDSILDSNQSFELSKDEIIANKNIYTSLYYTDNSIKDFMSAYAQREDFDNTIFIITGDHRLIPITQKDKLCRFHVPLYIYSPMLKRPEKFKSVSSHWDVTPSLISLLMNNYEFNNLEETAWMGQGLDTVRDFRNIHQIPLMRYKGSINDFLYKDYLYSDGELFKINENFGTNKIIDEVLLKTMADSLMAFKELNAYITQRNKIFPDSLNIYVKPSIEFSVEQLSVIKELTANLNYDQIFQVARDKAFNKERENARLLCDYILNELPNHSDARTLKGRILSWDGQYEIAEKEFLKTIKRQPFYDDPYVALLDLYWWSDQDDKGVALAKKALRNKIENPLLSFKLAKAHKRLKQNPEAVKVIDSLLRIYPKNKEYMEFKKSLK